MRTNFTGIRDPCTWVSRSIGQSPGRIWCTGGGMPMAEDVNFARVNLSFPDKAKPIADWLAQEMQRWICQCSGEEVKVDIALER
jgi:hypothetical protein